MPKVQIGELRDRVSHYVRRAEHGETIVVVNRNREVAVLAPIRRRRAGGTGLYGCLRGSARVVGDIVGPMVGADVWFRA
jgi:prevent-host-death family protein